MENLNQDNIRIVKGSERFAGASDTDFSLKIPLTSQERNYIDGDRSKIIDLQERFDIEREESKKFNISGKITNIFENKISGQTTYEPFLNNLYYLNAVEVFENNSPWRGYPQYDEFTFLRKTSIKDHLDFKSKSAHTYNWMMYVSYPYTNDYEQSMKFTTKNSEGNNISNNFSVSDGVPYYVKNKKVNGKKLVFFYCGFKHNLNEGDWVNLKYGTNKLYEVYSLGDEYYGNEDKVFSVYDYGYDDDALLDYSMGTFKRITDINNSGETMSRYYVRKHKLLTDFEDYDISMAGFENIPYKEHKKVEYPQLKTNGIKRIYIKEDSRTVSYNFKKEINIDTLVDNNGRPITELFVTIINRGYMGWFNNPINQNSNCGLQVGWSLNFLEDSIDSWWNVNNFYNKDNFTSSMYQKGNKLFYYNTELNKGDTLKGDVCEFNDYEQTEIVLSEIYHKYSFNPNLFLNESPITLPNGYAYQVHYPIKIKSYGDSIEIGDKDKTDNIPYYSFYSKSNSEWRWRDLYSYGYIDTDGNGVDHPFLNGSHYPFKDILFLQTPLIKNINSFNEIIINPTTDYCE
jgi:hypothetical protein